MVSGVRYLATNRAACVIQIEAERSLVLKNPEDITRLHAKCRFWSKECQTAVIATYLTLCKKSQKPPITMLFNKFLPYAVISCKKWIIQWLTLWANAAESGKTKSHYKTRFTVGNRG